MKLLGKAHDAAFWASVRQKECYRPHLEELHGMWEKYGGEEAIPTIRYRDFILFWQTGDRATFEKSYFDRRRMLESCALLALIYPEKPQYLDRLSDVIFAVCGEYSWCLPAHLSVPVTDGGETVSYHNPHPSQRNRIDLFAAETALMLSEIVTLLSDRLPLFLHELVDAEIDRRVFATFTDEAFFDHWVDCPTNWAAVCMGSVACSMMLLRPALARTLLPRFEHTIHAYLGGLMEDGVCTEGLTYWHYGFGYFLLYADMVKAFTDAEIDHFSHPKVRATVDFVQNMFLSGKAAVSFADAHRSATYQLGILHYLKARFPEAVKVYSPAMAHFASPNPNISLRLWSFIHLCEDVYEHPSPDDVASTYYAPSAQWLVKRTASYGFAAKGGYNDELHNHNDVGSFIFAKNGRQILADIGPAVYTKQYFSAERYDIFEASSRSHSVPVIGEDGYQIAHPDTHATDVCFDGERFSMNVAPAYHNAALRRLDRTFTLREDAVTLHDVFDCDASLALTDRLVSLVKPVLTSPDTLTLAEASVTFDPSVGTPTVRTEPLSRGGECYVIDFKLKNGAKEFSCTIR